MSAKPYKDYSHRYARKEDWYCLMWAWDTIADVQERWGGPNPWRQSAGGEKAYADRTEEAHEILRRHGAKVYSGRPTRGYHFTRPGVQAD